jgi:hypothetical protein
MLFGDIPFKLYVESIYWLVGFSIKHLWACAELLKKENNIELINIITITSESHEVIETFSTCLNIDYLKAKQIFDCLTLRKENTSSLQKIDSPPPFIQITRGGVLRSIWGTLDNPFSFLLRELKRKYPTDWDKSLDEREDRFRDDFNKEFISITNISGSIYSVNIKNKNKILTDIDAMYFDKRNGELALVQLKWQDKFLGMKERDSKKYNLISTGNKWISIVTKWLRESSDEEVIETLRLKEFGEVKISKVYLFVVGRHQTIFTGDETADKVAAWTSWPRLYNILHKNKGNKQFISRPIDWLFKRVSNRKPSKTKKKSYLKIPIGKYNIEVESLEIDDCLKLE